MTIEELKDIIAEEPKTLAGIARLLKMTSDEAEEYLLPYLDRGEIVSPNGKKYTTAERAGLKLVTIVSIKSNSYYARDVRTNKEYRLSGQDLHGFIVSDEIYISEPTGFTKDSAYIGFYRRKNSLVGNLFRRPRGGFMLQTSVTSGTAIKVFVKNDPEALGAVDGDLIQARIIESTESSIYVNAEKVLAKATEVGFDITSIIASKNAPMEFQENTMIEASKVPSVIDEAAVKGRVDYRNHLVCTIDGADALDFDDAVEIGELPNNCHEIIVHIADVSAYVRAGTALDQEAQERGTSIYVADRVVPMLPKELSNGICSLNPGVDRFTMSISMWIDSRGNVFQSELHPGVIRSSARLTYSEVNDFLDGHDVDLPIELQKMIKDLFEVSKLIRARRTQQGALELDSTELKFYLDSLGRPLEVEKRVQKDGEKLIEDLMIIANIEVAKILNKKNIPTLYRIHENPPTAKIDVFKKLAQRLKAGHDFPTVITPKGLSSWLSSIEDEERRKTISRLLLRSLAKARYSPDNLGHFGLAEENYLHFTSPIRRYPDLLVHRIIREYLFSKKRVPERLYDEMVLMGEITSFAERRATEIERAVDDLESAKYMTKHLEEYFDATVTGLASFGAFVELDNGIDAVLEYAHIGDDYYVFDEDKYEARGKTTHKRIILGMKLRVISLSSDIATRHIDVCDESYFKNEIESLSASNLKDLSKEGITFESEEKNTGRRKYGYGERSNSYSGRKNSFNRTGYSDRGKRAEPGRRHQSSDSYRGKSVSDEKINYGRKTRSFNDDVKPYRNRTESKERRNNFKDYKNSTDRRSGSYGSKARSYNNERPYSRTRPSGDSYGKPASSSSRSYNDRRTNEKRKPSFKKGAPKHYEGHK